MSGARALGTAVVFVGVLLTGCGDGWLSSNRGQLEVEGHSASGEVTVGRQVDWDFGGSYAESPVSGAVRVRNDGRGDFSLDSAELQDESGAFAVDFTPSKVPVGGSIEIPITFTPPAVTGSRPLQARLVLHASGVKSGEDTAEVRLHGLAVTSPCALPEVFDFGTVELDVTYPASLPIENPLSHAARAEVQPFTSDTGDEAAFGFGLEGLPGALTLPADSTTQLPLTFRPTLAREYEARLKVRAGAGCPMREVTVRGTGVQQVLLWDEKVSFGYVPVGLQKQASAVLRNIGTRDVVLSELHILSGEKDFALAPETPLEVTVPARGTAELAASFHPGELGPRAGTLTFKTPLAYEPQGVISLEGYGGGPDIEVHPADLLQFGKVGFVPSATRPLYQSRRVYVTNAGTRFSGAGPEANLHFREAPFTLTPANPDTAPDEFQVSLPDDYDNAVGLPAVPRLNTVALTVRLTPKSIGRKEATLVIHTDDLDEPDVTLAVVADVVQVPPCHLRVSPAAIEFGVLTSPNSRTQHFTIQNLGALPDEHCLLAMVELSPGSDGAFSLPDGSVPFRDLGPGEELEVAVKATAPPANPIKLLKGGVQFQVNAPASPLVTVPLSGASAEQCLHFTPDQLSFGTVRAGCSSLSKSISIDNACTQSVTVTALSVDQPGNEYLLTAPPLGAGKVLGIGNLPLQAQVTYSPVVSGQNPATLKVSATQFGADVTYLIPISGAADSTGTNTDSFTQNPKTPVDILFGIDPGSGISLSRQQLKSNMWSFFDYLQKAQLPYQLAVVNCWYAITPTFISGPTNPELILDPSVPDVVNKAMEKIDVPGISGGADNCFDTFYGALTPPLVTGSNAGFMRPNARLALVAVALWENSTWHTTNFYLREIPKLKGVANKQLVTFNAIAPIDAQQAAQCGYSPESGDLRALAALTGGMSAEICSYSWADTLRDIAERATGFKTSFTLSEAPDLAQAPLSVKVNGASVSAVNSSGLTVWTYEPGPNRVRFEADQAPQPGDTIDISYAAQCQ